MYVKFMQFFHTILFRKSRLVQDEKLQFFNKIKKIKKKSHLRLFLEIESETFSSLSIHSEQHLRSVLRLFLLGKLMNHF